MQIKAFQGLRPVSELADKVASLPYDVVSTEEARALAAGNPLSMLHIVRAEIDFPEGTSAYSDAVYAKACANFVRLQEDGVLKRESEPCLYLYRQQMGSHVQRGVVTVCRVEDYEQGLIKKHEFTRADKEDDRTRLTSDMSANAGPVFLTYRGRAEIDALVAEAEAGLPVYDFVAHDGIRHTAWRIPGGDALVAAFTDVPCFYIADGHHRAASAARVGRERRARNPRHTGLEDYNYFMAVLFPANQLNILPYNRMVADLNGHSTPAFFAALEAVGTLQRNTGKDRPTAVGEVSVYLEGNWHTLLLAPALDSSPVAQLDVSRLQDQILAPLLGVADPRRDQRIEFVGGIRGSAYLKEAVDSGRAAVAFAMYPTTCDQLMAISDADAIMPPKSTWFEPKLRSGLFIHTFERPAH